VNGQVHGGLPSDFVARHLKFDYLKDHLLVSIDCTGMEPTVREDFFMASRDRVRKNEAYDEVVEHLKDALRDHAGLRALNAARRKKEIEDTLSNENETKNLFSELLKADPTLASLFGFGDRLVTRVGPGPEPTFDGKKFPTFFRLVKNPQGGLVKHCPVNLTCRVEFETDATNDYFKRADCPGLIAIDPPNIIEHSHLWNGRFTMQLRTPWDAKAGDQIPVTTTVEDVETRKRDTAFISSLTIVAQPEAEPRTRPYGPYPPGPRNGGKSPGTRAATSLAIPELKWKSFDDRGTSLQIRHDDLGNAEYFANSNNEFLTAELIRSKEEDRPLVKFWFGYGLLLCALGMMKTQQDRAALKLRSNPSGDNGVSEEEANDTADDVGRIASYCDGIARVIVPIIRTLYRGPQMIAA
jgi:hypothetical protein